MYIQSILLLSGCKGMYKISINNYVLQKKNKFFFIFTRFIFAGFKL